MVTVAGLDDLPEYLTAFEAARVARTTEEYIRRQCKQGAIVATNLRGPAGYRIHRDALRKFLGSGDPPPAQERPPRGRKPAR